MAARYHSTSHAIATIIREERFIGLYKGITSPLVSRLASTSCSVNQRVDCYTWTGHGGICEWYCILII